MPIAFTASYIGPGRAPRGARGLKSIYQVADVLGIFVVPLAGHVD